MTLVDSNILLDIFGRDDNWSTWSLARLTDAALRGPLLINDIIYAESSIRFSDAAEFETVIDDMGIAVAPFLRSMLFVAGKAFATYREAGGARDRVLPNFFIGAHAAVSRIPLLTRDTKRYRTYFPTVTLIAPDEK